jgi:hypothetical protein
MYSLCENGGWNDQFAFLFLEGSLAEIEPLLLLALLCDLFIADEYPFDFVPSFL